MHSVALSNIDKGKEDHVLIDAFYIVKAHTYLFFFIFVYWAYV